MKRFDFIISFFVFILLSSCEEIADYNDEIVDTYREARRDSFSGVVIEGNMWSKISKEPLAWNTAVSYCEELKELEYSDWKLPTIDELRTLIQHCPATETGGSCQISDDCLRDDNCPRSFAECFCESKFYDDYESYYCKLTDTWFFTLWSSTPGGRQDSAVYVDFHSAKIYATDKYVRLYVRCMR